jgi:hypothetical protein
VFGADLVALAGKGRPGLLRRAVAWYLSRMVLASKTPVVLLPLAPEGARARSREPLAVGALR